MKKFYLIVLLLQTYILFAQNVSFGDKMSSNELTSINEINNLFTNLEAGEFNNTKFKATVVDVCKMKGCWMNLDLNNNKQVMVRFKNYGFFVPKDIEGKDVIVEGKAFIDVLTVDELKHYAFDAGKSKEEIDKIQKEKRIYSFEATGVVIP
tara:strand:+ start:42043 stop:42495 length:453 start_codon:yes stop_codon:yes gene_type:complete